MLFSDISYIDPQFTIHHHAYIGVRGRLIDYIGSQPPAAAESYGKAWDGRGKLLLPGFYNAHSHTAMTLLRGYGENLPLDQWLHQRIFPFEAHLTYDDIYWAVLLGCAEMLRYGVVSTTDMYMNGAALGDGFRDGGVKANFSIGATCVKEKDYHDLPQYVETQNMIDHYHKLDEGRLKVDYSLHAEYTSSETMVRTLAEEAAASGLCLHLHLSETAAEVEGCRQRRGGRTPVQYLNSCGIFESPTVAAHCVHLEEGDIELLAANQVTVATCPKSNLKLASGVCPAAKLLARGVNLALGTDSVASNNNLNMIEEMRFFALLHKGISGDPTLITPAQALAAATVNGARSQGRPDCGSIAVGNRADLVVADVSQPALQPVHDLLNNLVYAASGSDVVLTMVDGVIRYDNGTWPGLDIEKIIAETERSRQRILGELQG